MALVIGVINILILFSILIYQRYRFKSILKKHNEDLEKIVRGYKLYAESTLKRNYDLCVEYTGKKRNLN